ncbi:MAG TPA: substrate-binding domain-containing protein, partial [Treponema sp.]|nr:substrate-binding domain-containing protein [Treponema sp.]
MRSHRNIHGFLLSVTRLSISIGAAVLLFLVFPSPIPSIISLLVFVCGVFLFITARKNDRHKALLLADTENTLKEMSRQIAHGISSFAAGDLRYRLSVSDQTCTTEEAESVAKRLRTSIEDFNGMTATPPKRTCFVGANGYEEGRVAGIRIQEMLSGSGSIAYFIPAYTQVNHVLRMKGCRDYLAEHAPGIKTAAVFETDGDPENAANKALQAVSDFPDLSLIYITDGHSPGKVGHALAEKNINIKILIYDATPDNIDMLKKGMITALIEQNTFAQTWNAFMHLFNACESSWKPATAKMYMDPIYVDRENYTTYWDDVQNKRVMREEEIAQLVQPLPYRSGKKYKFGVLMPQTNDFFAPLVAGAEAAAKELAPYGVEIEVCNAYNNQTDFGSAKLYNPIIQSFIDRGFDGFITGIIDPNVMYGVNKAVDQGLTVTTFSTEPSSFREIILTMIDNAESLVKSSQNLAAAAEESARANTQIGRSISGIR